MLRGALRTVRYARSWKGDADVTVEDVEFMRDGERVEATLMLPRGARAPLPGWIAVGGVSRMGRHHPQLVRFSRALASSGAAVLVPEVPEWRRLSVVPGVAEPTIRGGLEWMEKRAEVREGKCGLIGFSFGAPQVAIAAAQEDLAERVAGIVLFGGYYCLERTLVCQLTGDHEWEGVDYSLTPDPYGGWIVGSNHLTDVEGFEDASDVAQALRKLATEASTQRISAWEPHHDLMIRELRSSLPERRRPLFDLFATPSKDVRPEQEERLEIALKLAEACRRVAPLLEPASELDDLDVPTRLIHGRTDRLIPFTEGMRLMAGLPRRAQRDLSVTGLFNHSADSAPIEILDRAVEGIRMFGTIRGMINTV
jgi:pimeloyl-ACP methyl ester carboxylesterase